MFKKSSVLCISALLGLMSLAACKKAVTEPAPPAGEPPVVKNCLLRAAQEADGSALAYKYVNRKLSNLTITGAQVANYAYFYDEKGRVETVIAGKQNTSPKYYHFEYHYMKVNILLTSSRNGMPTEITEISTDKTGRPLAMITRPYGSGSLPTQKFFFTYNADSNIVKVSEFGSGDILKRVSYYTYDKKVNPYMAHPAFDAPGFFKCGSRNNIASVKDSLTGKTTPYSYQYYDNGNVRSAVLGEGIVEYDYSDCQER